jgi:hypothetical protein
MECFYLSLHLRCSLYAGPEHAKTVERARFGMKTSDSEIHREKNDLLIYIVPEIHVTENMTEIQDGHQNGRTKQ